MNYSTRYHICARPDGGVAVSKIGTLKLREWKWRVIAGPPGEILPHDLARIIRDYGTG